MNSLSQMIYLAEVSGGLDKMLVVVTGLAVIASAAACATTCMFTFGSPYIFYGGDKEKIEAAWERNRKLATKWLRIMPCVALASGLLAALVPSEETIYAIAASELGEEVISSPTAGKAMKALDAWLDRQISDGQPTGDAK